MSRNISLKFHLEDKYEYKPVCVYGCGAMAPTRVLLEIVFKKNFNRLTVDNADIF